MTGAETSKATTFGKAGTGRCVLQVVPEMAAGGVPRTAIEVARGLTSAGWRAVVASAGGPGVAALEEAGATHVTLPLASKNPFTLWRNAARLGAVIEAHGVALVHARSRAPAWSAEAAARRAGVAFVTTFHGTYGHASALKRRYNAVMTRGDAVIANSRFIAEHIEAVYGVPAGRIVVIHRGVDAERFDPARVPEARVSALREAWSVPRGRRVVMLPGRLTGWKGQRVLIEAIADLGRYDLVCLLVGDGQGRSRYRAELESLIARHGLGEVVRIVGHCDDMPAAYLLADLVVSASTDPEAFGRVAVEAQAMGRAVIATAHGGSLETVVDRETGWLVPPGDVRALARALMNLWQPRAALDEMGRAGRAMVGERFDTEAMCRATLDVYRRVLKRNG